MSEQRKRLEPTRAQQLAKSFKGADLLVSAGAGSGKTSTLAERIIEKLSLGEEISKKLIVTFTNDAANELRAKISTSLGELLASNPKNQALATQLVRLASADICTIDSFCLRLVRENFESLELDGGFRMADESETEVLCRDAMSEIIDTLYDEKGDDEGFLAVCECFGAFSGEEKLKDDLLKLYKRLLTTKGGLETLLESKTLEGDFIDTPYGEVIKHHALCLCTHYIDFFESALEQIKDNEGAMKAYADAFATDRAFIVELRSVIEKGTYEQISEQIQSYSPASLGKTTTVEGVDTKALSKKRNDFKSAIRDELAGVFCVKRDQLEWVFEQNERMCRALYDVLRLFDDEYTKKKRSASVCDFNDVSRYAMRLLYDGDGQISALAREIAERYEEIYVDEYQDTNYIQDRIFYAISRENRYLVGDIKQSIYAFRSADPEIFSSYRRGFTPLPVEKDAYVPTIEELRATPNFKGAQIAMSENFRCDKSIIEFSNAVSNHMFLSSRGIPYDKSDELKFSKLGCDYESDKTEVYLIDKNVEPSDDDEELSIEAEFVAQRIAELLKDGTLADGTKIRPEHITILLRGFNRPVSIYRSALAKRGIPSTYKGDERFFEKGEVLLALCVLNAIDNPTRDIYLAGAMRSCVFGFTLEELAIIRQRSSEADSLWGALKAYSLDDELGKKITEFLEKLQKYREECRKLSCCEALSLIYADTSLMTMASESERKSLLKLYSIARSYESGKNKGIYGFLRYVEGIKEGSAKEELGDTAGGSVRLMSIHASKGLQFEVCFVSACGAKITARDASEDMIFVNNLGVNTYVYRPHGLAKYNTILRKIAQIAKKREVVEEEMRMLYVAMTRARSRLIITGALSNPQEFWDERKCASASEYSTLNPKCYLDWILRAIGDSDVAKVEIVGEQRLSHLAEQGEEYVAPTIEDEADIEKIRAILEERLSFSYPYNSLSTLPSKLSVSKLSATVLDSEQGEDDDDGLELDDIPSFVEREQSASASEIGTATHTFLQFCDFKLLEQNGATAELERLVSEAYLSKRASELVNLSHIELFVKSELFKQITSAVAVHRELRFNMMFPTEGLYKEAQLEGKEVLVQGICDIILENEGGEVVLIDYKTDSVTEENYEQRLRKSHEFQLKYYKMAVEKMFKPTTLRAQIYSVPLGKCVEM